MEEREAGRVTEEREAQEAKAEGARAGMGWSAPRKNTVRGISMCVTVTLGATGARTVSLPSASWEKVMGYGRGKNAFHCGWWR
jgi:hypothetical protein